jgi:hypothetical protein
MKTKSGLYKGLGVLAAVLLASLAGACVQPLGDLEAPPPATTGRISFFITGSENAANGNPRTMLALDPSITRYELSITGGGQTQTFQSTVSRFQIDLLPGPYNVTATGFSGDKPVAKTETEVPIYVILGVDVTEEFTVKPYMDPDIYGTLHYSLTWDSVGQIPAQAELLIEHYNNNGTPEFTDDTWDPLPISLMNESVTAGSRHGSLLLLQRSTGLAKQNGSLDLPPGDYRLTTTVAMDSPYPPVNRMDIAHIFSNLITPAAFFYGSGDLIVTNPGTDTGSGFITSFNFSDPSGVPINATSIIASNPGPDGTRLIMVTVPASTNLTYLTPVVECAPGASVISPPPVPGIGLNGQPGWFPGDYSRPTTWIAEGRNGVTQEYTVVVNNAADDSGCAITDLAFRETKEVSAPTIDQFAGEIEVTVPYGTTVTLSEATTVTLPTGPVLLPAGSSVSLLTPVFSYIGTKVMFVIDTADSDQDKPLSGKVNFGDLTSSSGSQYFRVYPKSGAPKLYKVTVTEALSDDAIITDFVIDGYPDPARTITPNDPGIGTITYTVPYGTNLANLKPLITYKGNLSPASGVERNFSVPDVPYIVTSQSGTKTKTYNVTITPANGNTDARIFDFVITNVPKAKVVIGTNPRADGKIPIVVQVPYGTSPFIVPAPPDGPKTDLMALIPKITLSGSTSKFVDAGGADTPAPNGTTDCIPFGNQNDYQEAVYRIKPQAGDIQDYVVVVARDVQYYYVKATGSDPDPDLYNGGSESTPFKTLAHAVYQAVKHDVKRIYVIGTLDDTTEGGAWENTSGIVTGNNGVFNASGASPTGGGASVFNLIGTGKDGGVVNRIYITGVGTNAVLKGTSGKRVISVTGGAHITFENITIQDGGSGSYTGNGGGVFVGGGSTIIWNSGVIKNNQAASGGGLYLDNSYFDFHAGSISGNTATGTAATGFTTNTIAIQGGGGVYVNGDSQFWLATGDISANTTSGSGGGVLVNGSVIPNNPNPSNRPDNFIMSAGTITGNNSKGSFWPHGGGGVFVAKGTFEMLNGRISENRSTRQGGGVFVWSRSLFYMEGGSSVVNNTGVGSSAAICSRGITEMRGNAQADKVYIWNYSTGPWNNGQGDMFTMMEGARITGLELAFADDPKDNRNFVNIVLSGSQYFTGTGPITTIGLESRLTSSGAFDPNATIAGDWLGKYLIKNNGAEIPPAQTGILTRFLLDSYIYGGANPIRLSGYKLDTRGRLAVK